MGWLTLALEKLRWVTDLDGLYILKYVGLHRKRLLAPAFKDEIIDATRGGWWAGEKRTVVTVFEKAGGGMKMKTHLWQTSSSYCLLLRSQCRCKKKGSSRFLSVSLWRPRLNEGVQWKGMGFSKLPCEQLKSLFYSKESKIRVCKRSWESCPSTHVL